MKPDDPHIVIANLMAFRLARAENPGSARMVNEAKIAGEMLFHAEKEGVERWRELRRKQRDAEKRAHERDASAKQKLSSSSAPSFSPGDTQ